MQYDPCCFADARKPAAGYTCPLVPIAIKTSHCFKAFSISAICIGISSNQTMCGRIMALVHSGHDTYDDFRSCSSIITSM